MATQFLSCYQVNNKRNSIGSDQPTAGNRTTENIKALYSILSEFPRTIKYNLLFLMY